LTPALAAAHSRAVIVSSGWALSDGTRERTAGVHIDRQRKALPGDANPDPIRAARGGAKGGRYAAIFVAGMR
jgi:DNA-binding response OmpR family regulator